MCHLFLVRHGQASFGDKYYDQLSAVGRQQACIVGQYFNNSGKVFNGIYHGSLARQVHTAQLIMHALGINFEMQQYTTESFKYRPYEFLNELNVAALLKRYSNKVLDLAPHLGETDRRVKIDRENFKEVFTHLIRLWAQDPSQQDDSFNLFQQRILQGIKTLTRDHKPGENILIVSSGGVIATLVQYALGLSIEETLNSATGLFNASITEIDITATKWQLLSFNSNAALENENNPALLTRL